MEICADSSIFKGVTPGTFVHTQMSQLLIQKDSYLRTYSSYVHVYNIIGEIPRD
jgi:hypothetical protein